MSNVRIEGLETFKGKLTALANSIDYKKAAKEALQPILDATKTEVAAKWPGLEKGVKFSFNPDNHEGKVHIMGDYRLKWLEMGTDLRKTSAGANRGQMPAKWYFRDVRDGLIDQAQYIYANNINEQIRTVWER